MENELREEEPYFVEVDTNGCAACGSSRTWTVIGPDGVALGQSWVDEDDADNMAEDMNAAYWQGVNRRPAPASAPPAAPPCPECGQHSATACQLSVCPMRGASEPARVTADLELAKRLRELSEKATKGEWLYGAYSEDFLFIGGENGSDLRPVAIIHRGKQVESRPEAVNNAELICALYQAIPLILSALERGGREG